MAHASFDGLRVLSLESRRAKEVAKLIKTYGGEAFVVPAMREVPLDTHQPVLDFATRAEGGRVRSGGLLDRRRCADDDGDHREQAEFR